MNGLVTEGIPLGIDVQILTSGLSFGEPIPPPEQETSSGSISSGVSYPIVDNQDGSYTGGFFNLPATSTRISVQVSGTVVTSVSVLTSLDGITFAPIMTFSAAGIQFVKTNAKWIQAITSGTDVTVTVNARREKF